MPNNYQTLPDISKTICIETGLFAYGADTTAILYNLLISLKPQRQSRVSGHRLVGRKESTRLRIII